MKRERASGIRQIAEKDRERHVRALVLYLEAHPDAPMAQINDDCAARCDGPAGIKRAFAWLLNHKLVEMYEGAAHSAVLNRRVAVYRLTEAGRAKAVVVRAEQAAARALRASA